jgi:hypothetical protein
MLFLVKSIHGRNMGDRYTLKETPNLQAKMFDVKQKRGKAELTLLTS